MVAQAVPRSLVALRQEGGIAWRHLRSAVQGNASVRYAAVVVLGSLLVMLLLGLWAGVGAPSVIAYHFNLERDRSAVEAYGYLMSGAATLFLARSWWRSGLLLYLALAALFGFVLFDDALQYHERVARHVLVPGLGLQGFFGARPQDTGELMAWTLAGSALLVPFGLALRQDAQGKLALGLVFAGLFSALVAFAVGVDMLHSVAGGSRAFARWLGFVEDGGEIAVLALTALTAFVLSRDPIGQPLSDDLVRRGLKARIRARRREARDEQVRAPARSADLHA